MARGNAAPIQSPVVFFDTALVHFPEPRLPSESFTRLLSTVMTLKLEPTARTPPRFAAPTLH